MLVALLGFSGCTASLQDLIEYPNIVFILADDMRLDESEYMPQSQQLLAEQGLTFENAFVTTPLCCPSRSTILRGQYAHNHQVLMNGSLEGGFEKFHSLGDEDSTLATWLQSGGYKTVLFGKYLNHYPGSDETYVPPGWDEWYSKFDDGENYYDYRLNENSQVVSYGNAEEDYYTDVLARQARDYVQRAADSSEPFFMYLAPTTPHGPFKPAPRHKDAYVEVAEQKPSSFNEDDVSDKPSWVQGLPQLSSRQIRNPDNNRGRRRQMLLSWDEMRAGLIEELQATGKLENTYIFFSSDNGYQQGEHRLRGKRVVYEESVRVPLAVRGPGIPEGESVDQMVLNNDFAPTIAELAGVSASEFVDGRSLVPLLSGTQREAWRSAFLIEHWAGGDGDYKDTPTYAAVRTETHKYIEYESGEQELYDLSSDPYELVSLDASADPTLFESLRTRLEALQACAERTCREAEDSS
jgi:N-acetylglucosamine-6-sulfatase